MNNNFRVLNITRGFTVKHKHALRAIRECGAAWVEYGVSIRDLTLAEAIAARNQQAKMREPLEYSELFGIRFEPPAGGEHSARESGALVFAAGRFAADEAAKV